jgi:uroporphyrinogen-III synthase
LEHKYHILSTALLPEDSSAQFSAHNIICDEFPFIQTKEAVTDEIRSLIVAFAHEKKAIIFTSAQAVSAVIDCLGNKQPDWQIFCISGATKKAANDYFGAEAIVGFADDAIGLVKEIEKIPLQEIVFFCGNKRLDTLPVLLYDKGFRVSECIVYETALTPVKLNKAYDAILFFSPSGVESYLSENEIATFAVLFSIGKTTAKALQQKVPNEVIISAHPDKHILVQTVIDFYKKQTR